MFAGGAGRGGTGAIAGDVCCAGKVWPDPASVGLSWGAAKRRIIAAAEVGGTRRFEDPDCCIFPGSGVPVVNDDPASLASTGAETACSVNTARSRYARASRSESSRDGE